MKLHPDATLAPRVLELKYDEREREKKYVVVGTVFKDMKLKPNILQEYTQERSDIKDFALESLSLSTCGNRLSDDDSVVLEDVSGRVSLLFKEKHDSKNKEVLLSHKDQVDRLVTGIIVGLYGSVDEHGHFLVHDIIFSDLATQNPLPSLVGDDQYVAFVSGLSIGHPKFSLQNTQNLIDYLTGALGGDTEQDCIISKIARVVVTGDSVWQDVKNQRLFDVRGSLRPVERASMVEPSKAVDQLIEQLGYSVHVDVMPGEFDPSNTSLPQQPLHPSMLPKSSQLTTCHLVTNPYMFQLSGIDFLGTSGQAINDLRLYSNQTDTLELMESTLRWGHLAPTAPDTLNCYPFCDSDPFIISLTPHVYFTGNQPTFETRLLQDGSKKVRLISLPSFVETGIVVLVNLKNLDVHPIQFDTEHMLL